MKNFTHFRLYTECSICKSIVRIEEILERVKNNKQRCICITDTNNLFNTPRFYNECLKKKIKPIIGCDLKLKYKKNIYNIALIIKNNLGYINICKLISKSLIYNKGLLSYNFLKGVFKKNLFLIFNLNYKNFNKFNNFKSIKNDIKHISKNFKNQFYLEIQKNKKNYKKILNISHCLKLPILATSPIYFSKKKDFLAYKAKICIFNKKKKKIFKNNFFKTSKKINKIFYKLPNSIKNVYELQKKCNFIMNFNKIKIPFFNIKKKINNKIYFLKLLKKKLKIFLNNNINNDKNIYKERLINEVKTIIKMDLVDYFLIVKNFISWSKKKKFQVGPGRGSCAGSLVSFLLNITELDPIKYNLLFERFLNSERQNIPDFDIDFCQFEREKVIEYIKKKYGIDSVCQIVTFNKMALKNSIKDIGKFLKFNYYFINEINKIIEKSYIKINNTLDLLKKNKFLLNIYNNNYKVKKLIKLSIKLEGLIKNFGTHAGGVVISSNSIFYHMPIFIQNNIIVSQYFKDDIEKIGILKFDFLGLSTLSIIKNCLKSIEKNIILKKIKLNDKKCFKNLKKANTVGVFQLESDGIRKFLKKIKPDNFENIIALISLYRPGPIKLINDFHLRKIKKKKTIYIDKKLKSILKETHGIIVYQEQIIQIVKEVAAYDLNEADLFRIMISKKKLNEMINQKKIFIEKAIKNGFDSNKANMIFNIIKEFANYGFNKSHATAYSLLSYYTLWLKSYYIDYFMASNMSFFFKDLNKLNLIINDSIKNNIKILPLNINESCEDFINLKNQFYKKIRLGFKGLIGLGENIINHIIFIRKKKKFKSFFDFYKRVDKRLINYKSMEILISGGCFDSLNYNRANLIKKLIILSKINFKKNEKIINLKNIYFKKNYFWKFKKKILEEKLIFSFFINNNIYNLYKKRFLNFMNFNKNIIKGVILNIKEKINNNFFIIYLINEKNKILEIKINKNIFIKNISIINKYKFIIILVLKKKINNNSKILLAEKIINFKNVKNKIF
ncbi:DNA polymerase III subunit alpha [Candidatus Nasuia deltocephalinicola]|uniref:DNA polymerase III subunit alpha n=1 Tax=Candidatus Nasuia deltocephalincola TaxID=1160784 RepID=UPI00216ABA34|nr:DNA polymerase III subunit alpha [Candidatus Nasuia deltocephalinicola]